MPLVMWAYIIVAAPLSHFRNIPGSTDPLFATKPLQGWSGYPSVGRGYIYQPFYWQCSLIEERVNESTPNHRALFVVKISNAQSSDHGACGSQRYVVERIQSTRARREHHSRIQPRIHHVCGRTKDTRRRRTKTQ